VCKRARKRLKSAIVDETERVDVGEEVVPNLAKGQEGQGRKQYARQQ
jgi:hypothetical protein